jgi:hypothetical protein
MLDWSTGLSRNCAKSVSYSNDNLGNSVISIEWNGMETSNQKGKMTSQTDQMVHGKLVTEERACDMSSLRLVLVVLLFVIDALNHAAATPLLLPTPRHCKTCLDSSLSVHRSGSLRFLADCWKGARRRLAAPRRQERAGSWLLRGTHAACRRDSGAARH